MSTAAVVPPPILTSPLVLPTCSPQELPLPTHLLNRTLPLVIRGAFSPLLPISLAVLIPTSTPTISVMVASDDKTFLDDPRYAVAHEVSTETFLSALTESRSPYPGPRMYHRTTVPTALARSIHTLPFISTLSSPSTQILTPNSRLWISTPGSLTPLHYDRCHGLLIQLHGTKRFCMIPRDEVKRSGYLHDGISGPSHASRMKGTDEAFVGGIGCDEFVERWPRVRETVPWVVTLEPGDALFTPCGWLHEVTSLTASVSVTVPWDLTAEELDERPAFMAF
ncbi:hypothetical protein HKX48_000909 [Thoreauomyces humboldtii]|nr:hypothetical protein HKX48_000909 [Thoreauomyces humboldtii]